MSAQGLTWEQVAAWRYDRQGLLRRADKADWPELARRVGGLHARSLAAAELAVWARAEEVKAGDMNKAIGEERSLAKTWAMQGEPYLFAAVELPLILSALRESAPDYFRKPSWLGARGITLRQLDLLTEGVGAVLGEEPQTPERLADAVARHTGQESLRGLLLTGWSELLRPAASLGLLCFGPNEGESVTFVRPDQWIKRWIEHSEKTESALLGALRRYVACSGPATFEDFGRWWDMEAGKVKKLFRLLEEEIVSVPIEGREGLALRKTVEEIRSAAIPEGTVRLLPQFDPYTVSLAQRSTSVLAETYKSRVYGSQGWVNPVVAVGGKFAGTWATEEKQGRVELKVEWFEPSKVRPPVRAALEEEAARLVEYYESELILRC
ncbi:winged helix DNA-binding domain-containing protein [Paenibacillus hodogayensis]|uniref:Winged helix DNA-binding domain-containing protein n=1 Tax=Paenibacillus hodogayensis TaxID=279208 RepID=A0ABV5W002_9BACL